MYPHCIRLRGPWEIEPLARAAGDVRPLPLPGRVTVPASWPVDFAGRARFRRRFGYPGRIDAHERVWLTFADIRDRGEATLNGTSLGSIAQRGEFDITALLRPRNELLVEVEGGSGGGLVGEVALEVRATAFLRDVSVAVESSAVVATGEVVGRADGLLELYLILDRRPADYAQAVEGTFRLRGEVTGGEPPCLAKIELVRGGVAWYIVEVELPGPPAQGPSA